MDDQATKGKGIKFCPLFVIIILLFFTFGDKNYGNTTIKKDQNITICIQLFQFRLSDQSLKPTRQDRRGICDPNE